MSRVFVVAEVGQAHDGSLGILHSYIDALASTGVDAVKFQIHIAEAESSPQETWRVAFSYQDRTRMDYWHRMSFTTSEWKEVKAHCSDVGLEFMASPFSLAAVDLLSEVGVKRYKIGSGEVTNYLMLEKIARTGKPIVLSSGMSSYEELDQAIEFLRPFGNDLTIVQCTTSYPTSAENLGLNVIGELKARYPDLKVGLSEHTGKIYAGLAGTALGIDLLEFHVVFDRRMFGPDASSSLTIDEVKTLIDGIRMIETSLDNPVDKTQVARFAAVKELFEKSLAINKNLPKGHILAFQDLESKKPANQGIPASKFRSVIGRALNKSMTRYSFLKQSDLDA